MGANVWQRDGDAGKSFVIGVHKKSHQAPRGQHAKKRKLVWSRADTAAPEGAAAPSGEGGAAVSRGSGHASNSGSYRAVNGSAGPASAGQSANGTAAATPAADHAKKQRLDPNSPAFTPASQPSDGSGKHGASGSSPAAAAAAATAAFKGRPGGAAGSPPVLGMNRLKHAISQQQRQLNERQAAVQAAEEAAVKAARDAAAAAERRRQIFQAAFAEAFEEAHEEAAVATAAARTAAPAADVAEVARVLAARSDYACLKLPAGASKEAIRARYKEMARALHPDRCRVEGAKNAFQRLFEAYNNLHTYAA